MYIPRSHSRSGPSVNQANQAPSGENRTANNSGKTKRTLSLGAGVVPFIPRYVSGVGSQNFEIGNDKKIRYSDNENYPDLSTGKSHWSTHDIISTADLSAGAYELLPSWLTPTSMSKRMGDKMQIRDESGKDAIAVSINKDAFASLGSHALSLDSVNVVRDNFFVSKKIGGHAQVWKSDDAYYLVYRGTQSISDAITDAKLIFNDTTASDELDNLALNTATLAKQEGKRFIITGHSLGGFHVNHLAHKAAEDPEKFSNLQDATFIAHSSPIFTDKANVFNYGHEGDPIYGIHSWKVDNIDRYFYNVDSSSRPRARNLSYSEGFQNGPGILGTHLAWNVADSARAVMEDLRAQHASAEIRQSEVDASRLARNLRNLD